MSKKTAKKKQIVSKVKVVELKLVTSDQCIVCKKQCARGIRYMEHMSAAGSMGQGVPCILTGNRSVQ